MLNQNSVNFNINSHEFAKKETPLISPSQKMNNSLDERTIFLNPITQSLSPNNHIFKRDFDLSKNEFPRKYSNTPHKK